MAKRKFDQEEFDANVETTPDVETPIPEAEASDSAELTVPTVSKIETVAEPRPVKKVVEKPKPVVTVDVEAELAFAQQQIERCLDFTEIPGADFKGRFRPSLKEWRLYKYKLRQHALGNGPAPVRPTVVDDY